MKKSVMQLDIVQEEKAMQLFDVLISEQTERFGYESEQHFITNFAAWLLEDKPEGNFSDMLKQFIKINITTKNGYLVPSPFNRR